MVHHVWYLHPTGPFPPVGPVPLHDALLLITDIHGQDGRGVRTGRAITVHACWLRNYEDINNQLVLSGLK